jgi:Undecaprenyl-phosphate galactose phosphotransferase WbaP
MPTQWTSLKIDRICRTGVTVSDRNVAEQRSPVMLAPAELGRLRATNRKRWKRVWKHQLIVVTLILTDVLTAFLAWEVAYVGQSIWGHGELSVVAIAAIAPSVMVWVGLRALLGLYPGYGLDSAERLRRHTYSIFATLAVLAVFAVGFQVGNLLSRILLAFAFLGLLFLTPFVQPLVKLGLKKAKLWGKPVIILSYKETGAKFQELLEQEWGIGYTPVALLDHHLVAAGKSYRGVSCDETLTHAATLGRELGVDTVIFAMPHTRREQLAHMVGVASESFRSVLIVPNLNGVTNSAVVARDFAGTFAVEIKQNLLDPWSQRLKRALDLLGTVVGGVLISPLVFAIAIVIKFDSSGPAFYGHRRVGAAGKHFLCWKFRTMHVDAERLLDKHLQGSPILRAEWEQNQKLRDDPRVTRVGRLLRQTSLDELPQLWNVLRGEMSLTGPRPIVDSEVPKYGKVYELYKRIKPGMSGLWQVSGRSDTSYAERVEMDSYYVRNWSVWLDLIILARTVKSVALVRGAR